MSKKLWNHIKGLCKDGRNTIVLLPTRNAVVEVASLAFDEPDAKRMMNRGLFCVQITYDDGKRACSVKFLVASPHAADLVCRVKEQLLGRRDQDVVLVDFSNMNPSLKHELQCLAATFEAKLSILVSK